jgi:hypothetical protein
METILEKTVRTQYSMKKVIKMFGEPGINAVMAEPRQLHEREVMVPVLASSLDKEAKHNACGKIKGRECADGRKQRIYTTKQEAHPRWQLSPS